MGAKNIKDHISDKCFVDVRDFENLDNFYKYLKSIDTLKYQEMLNEVEKFLNSDESYSFSTKYLCEKIYSILLKLKN